MHTIAARVEHIEAEAWVHLQLALPASTRAELRTRVRRHGTAVWLAAPGADVAAMNRVVGLGFDRELTTATCRRSTIGLLTLGCGVGSLSGAPRRVRQTANAS